MNFTLVDKNNLEKVLEFLSEGFGWSLKRVNQVSEYIKCSNCSIEIYGFAIFDENDSICSAILVPFQGYLNKYKIISLMSLYSKKSSRGINSILFVQKVCKFLKSNQFIITDYTATKTVQLILQKFNFKNMNGCRKIDVFILKPHKLFYNFLSNRKNILSESKSYNFPLNNFKVTNYADANFMTFYTDKNTSSFCCVSRIVHKRIIGFNFPIPLVHILWAEDQNHLINNWDILCFLLFKKYKAFCIKVDFANCIPDYNQSFFNTSPLNYLISSDIEDIGFIPSLGSELCLTNINL